MSTPTFHSSGRPVVHVSEAPAATAGALIAGAIEAQVGAHGRCRLGLSGGSTPAPVYAWLRDHLPPALYPHLRVTWVDERHLPLQPPSERPDWQRFAPDSNLRLAWEHWLAHVPIDPAQVLPMSLGGALDEEVSRFRRHFIALFAGRLDVAVLGAGPDGHIASLFPGHPALLTDDLCLAVYDSPKPPPQRISLTLAVLEATEVAFVLASGQAKAEMLRAALAGDPDLPLGRYAPTGACHWVLDPPAASAIVAQHAATSRDPTTTQERPHE